MVRRTSKPIRICYRLANRYNFGINLKMFQAVPLYPEFKWDHVMCVEFRSALNFDRRPLLVSIQQWMWAYYSQRDHTYLKLLGMVDWFSNIVLVLCSWGFLLYVGSFEPMSIFFFFFFFSGSPFGSNLRHACNVTCVVYGLSWGMDGWMDERVEIFGDKWLWSHCFFMGCELIYGTSE